MQTLQDHQCDSQSDLGIDASALNDFVMQNSTSSDHVAIIAHSMGGAITRGYLALAQRVADRTGVDPSANVDTVVTMQGAQQGSADSWAGRALILSGATENAPYAQLIALAQKLVPYYLNRPAVTELTPKSSWYTNINATRVPAHIHYFNIYTRIASALPFGKWLTYAPIDWGDFVMRPGSDNPQDTPLLGGARFRPDPSTVASSYEWVLDKPYYIRYSTFAFADNSQAIPDILRAWNDPVSHLALSGHLDQLSVARTDGGNPSVAIPDCKTGAPTTITLQIEHVLADPAHACPTQ